MIQRAEGSIGPNISVAGNHIYPGYLIKGQKKALMIEAGINFLGPTYVRHIEHFFGDSALLDYILVTHSHYDHLGALSYLKRRIPTAKAGAAPRVGHLMKKNSVLSAMNFLSKQLWEYFKDNKPGPADDDIRIDSLDFDLKLQEGDVIDMGGMSCHVYETPGHTSDHLSYYVPEISVLFPGEALGNPAGDGTGIKVEFLTSYEDYMDSIEKLKKLDAKVIAMSHLYVYTGEDAGWYINQTAQATIEYRWLIEQYLNDAHGSIDSATNQMVKVEYDEKGSILMERNAYIANLKAQIKAVSEITGASG
ncbi:MAG: MBL fold metallo-hydrolase [Pseudomonadota bacterium]